MDRPDLFLYGRKSFTELLADLIDANNESTKQITELLADLVDATNESTKRKKRKRDRDNGVERHVVELITHSSSGEAGDVGLQDLYHNGVASKLPLSYVLTSIGGKLVSATHSGSTQTFIIEVNQPE
jgi:hypothetical protein